MSITFIKCLNTGLDVDKAIYKVFDLCNKEKNRLVIIRFGFSNKIDCKRMDKVSKYIIRFLIKSQS